MPGYRAARSAIPMGLEGWHRIIAVNQTSVFLGTKLAAEQMSKTGGGSIVNISSIMGFVGGPSGHPAYSASKGQLRTSCREALYLVFLLYQKGRDSRIFSGLRPCDRRFRAQGKTRN
jgi:NAD(P)-dependent dehydrogenase (short-subunit alcohol dehydrogenase family)